MFFVLERARKILDELKDQQLTCQHKVNSYRMKEGSYANLQEAESDPGPWRTYHSGDRWGGRDKHAWFQTSFVLPEELDGRTLIIKVETGASGWDATNPQFILYVNGELIQGLDVNHMEVIIDSKAEKGTQYQIDLHSYSGMDEGLHDLSLTFAAFEERVKDLYFDMQVPLTIADLLPEGDKNRIDILNVLTEALNLLDLRKPGSKAFHASVEETLTYMADEFYNKLSGHEDIIASCVGHTHIDVAWLWTLAQTREKTARSFSTVLKLMEQFPEYVFMSSQPQLYQYLKEDYPELYEKVKERIREGRWEPEGAMWVEADCNVTSGESLVRQVLFGTRFFEQEFGVKNEILWLPDVFGYSAALPQILKKSDIQYFMTTKISWNQFNKLPYDTFMWKGIDGTEILSHFITARDYQKQETEHYTTYNADLNPTQVMGAWQRYQQKNINNDVLISFGYGDGGGGPTIGMLENARRLSKGVPGCPKVKMTTAGEYFRKLEKKTADNKYLPKWVGELYLEYHRGTYTSMAKNKWYNRKNELLYQDVELLYSLNKVLGQSYPQEEINKAWEVILLNQFHDIIPGSSIYEVYEDSHRQYEQILKDGRTMLNQSLQALVDRIQVKEPSIVVFNSLSFKRNDVVPVSLPEGFEAVELLDENGNSIPYQNIESDGGSQALVYVEDIPAMGYKSFRIREASKAQEQAATIQVERNRMENQFFRVDLDEKGTILSLYDKTNQRQVLMENERGNRILAFEDRPMNYDNWDIDIYYQEKMWEVDEVQSIEVVESGPVRGCLRITKTFLDSVIVQDMMIYQDIPRVDFHTQIDWKEDQIMLKAAFPVDVHTDKATYEIQFGNVERPTHWNTSWDVARFEVCAQKWADLSEDNYGVSLLNDSKYGHDIRDGHMRLTLLKSGMYPNDKADRGHHEFTYCLYPHAGDWKQGNTVQMAHSVNVPLYAAYNSGNSKGDMPEAVSMLQLSCDNVILDTVKKAEDSDEIIIRMYEFCNRRTNAEFTFFKDLLEVIECNLMEKPLNNVPVQGNHFTFVMKPYEIKTFKLKVK